MKFEAPSLQELNASEQSDQPALAVFDPEGHEPGTSSNDDAPQNEPAAEALVEGEGPTADDLLAKLTTPPEPECQEAVLPPEAAAPVGPSQCEFDQLAEIQRLGLAVDMAAANLEEAKEHVKELKEEWEGCVEQLMQTVRHRSRPMPLFDKPAATSTTEAPQVSAEPRFDPIAGTTSETGEQSDAAALDEQGSEPPAAPKTWRDVSIDDLGIPANIVLLLRDPNKIDTLGELAEFGRWNVLTKLEKIGPGKADKINAALDEFWKANPDLAAAQAAEQAAAANE